MSQFKIGLDFHGVIDKDPKFYSKLSRVLISGGAQVHIITGNPQGEEIENLLHHLGMYWTHFYSIQDDLIKQGHIPNIQEGDNSLWFDTLAWDSAKGLYCQKKKISVHYDDSDVYEEYFKTPFVLV